MKMFKKSVLNGAGAMGFSVTEAQVEAMAVHAGELLAWNDVANLTAIKDPCELAEKQFLDVLPMMEDIPMNAGVLDIGAGGGFPGIPLGIMRPDISITMIDGRRKKVSFLKHVIRTLHMENARAIHTRAEELSGGAFGVVVSKAVGSIAGLLDVAIPLIGKNGRIISMKGPEIDEELEDVAKNVAWSDMKIRTTRYRLPFNRVERHLIIID